MHCTTINDAYYWYETLFGKERPIWDRDQLRNWIHREGLRYEEITATDMDRAFSDSLRYAGYDDNLGSLEENEEIMKESKMSRCERPEPGKFEGNACKQEAEELYAITLADGCNEELGEADGFGWYGLILKDKPMGEHLHSLAYIVEEDSQGFFSFHAYNSATEAKEAWSELEYEYEEWSVMGDDEI